MMAQLFLTALLAMTGLYAWAASRRAPVVGGAVAVASVLGLYFVWLPSHATWIAEHVGIGRGVDLILYVWVVVSLLAILNLHLALRAQLELVTVLVRRVAIDEAEAADGRIEGAGETVTQGRLATGAPAAKKRASPGPL